MDLRQRRILGAVGCLAVVAGVALGIAASDSLNVSGGDERLEVAGRTEDASSTTGRAPVSTDTTFQLVPVTTGVPVPDATEPPPRSTVPSATPAGSRPAGAPVAGAPAVTGDGAVLTRPAGPAATRPIDKAKGCHSAADAGWKVKECGALRTNGVVLVWVVETRGTGLRALVLREQTAGQWALVLAAADDTGTTFASIGVRGEDVSGDGQPELAFGFHRRAPDRVLAIDVVEGAGAAVTLHRELTRGSSRLAKGELATWSATSDTQFEHNRIRSVGGAWRVVATESVDKSAVPPSML